MENSIKKYHLPFLKKSPVAFSIPEENWIAFPVALMIIEGQQYTDDNKSLETDAYSM